jgi:hypothetical protein
MLGSGRRAGLYEISTHPQSDAPGRPAPAIEHMATTGIETSHSGRDLADTDVLWDRDRQLVELRGGPTVMVRPISTGDGPGLTAYLEDLSDVSRHMRFMQATPRVSHRLVEVFTHGDRIRSVVLVAMLDDQHRLAHDLLVARPRRSSRSTTEKATSALRVSARSAGPCWTWSSTRPAGGTSP